MGRVAASSLSLFAVAILCAAGALAGCGSSGAAQDAAADVAAAADAPVSGDSPRAGGDAPATDGGRASMDTTDATATMDAVHDTGEVMNATCPQARVFAAPCNALTLAGPVVLSTCSSDPAPAPQGGTMTDGLYFLESATWYQGCQPASLARSTWLVCGELWDNAALDFNASGGVARTNYLSSTQGTTNTLNPICSTAGPVAGMAYGYSASAGRLTLMSNYGNSVLVTTYALQ